MSLKIDSYKKLDEHGIMKLDNSLIVNKLNKRNLSNWYWKYKKKNNFIVVAKKNKKIVGHFASIKIDYILNKKKYKGAHTIGLMVKKKWQSRGLPILLFKKLIKLIKKKKIEFIYGLPNKFAINLHKFFFKYDIQLNLNNFFYKIKKSQNIEKNFLFKEINQFDKKYDIFLKKNINRYPFFVKRHSSFLNWRYSSRPDHNYYSYSIYFKKILKGYFVLKVYKDINFKKGHILDFFTVNEKKIKMNSLNFIINFFKNKNVRFIDTYFHGDKKLENIFISKGFYVKKKINLLCRVDNFFLKEKIKKKNFWFFSQGDSFEIY